MILEPDHWYLGYSQILTDCRNNGGSVLVCCHAGSVDSLCAARIWGHVLRQDGIPHSVVPLLPSSSEVAEPHDLGKLLQSHVAARSAEAIRAVVCLNVGATRNAVRALFDTDGILSPDATKVYIMDSARPIHLANYHAGDFLVVFATASADDPNVPSDGEQLSAASSSSEEDSDEESSDSSEDEDEQQDDDDEGEAEFDANPQDDMEEDSVAEDNSEADESPTDQPFPDQEPDADADADDEASINSRNSTRKQKDPPAVALNDTIATADETFLDDSQEEDATPLLSARELYQARRARVRAYYNRGTSHGVPAAFCAYKLATQLRFGSTANASRAHLLWWACLGVTDAYLVSKTLDRTGYSELALDLQTDVHRLFPNDVVSRVGQTIYAEDLLTTEANQQLQKANSGRSNDPKTALTFSQEGTLLAETDFRLFLLRHSSLYQALGQSDYIASQLRGWTWKRRHNPAAAEDRLKELLARMGLSLRECKQPFAFLTPSLRRRLPELLQQHAMNNDDDDEEDEPEDENNWGLDDLAYPSFLRVQGYGTVTSAADVVAAVSALLELPDSSSSALSLGAFHSAYDALGMTSTWRKGIAPAQKLQQRMLDLAHSLMERHQITTLHHFRYAYISVTNSNNSNSAHTADDAKPHNAFGQPLALTRLAHYLFDVHEAQERWTGSKARPLILLAQNPATDTHLVAGFLPMKEAVLPQNRFGHYFQLAADSLEVEICFAHHGDAMCHVPSPKVQRFMEQLHYLMDSL